MELEQIQIAAVMMELLMILNKQAELEEVLVLMEVKLQMEVHTVHHLLLAMVRYIHVIQQELMLLILIIQQQHVLLLKENIVMLIILGKQLNLMNVIVQQEMLVLLDYA